MTQRRISFSDADARFLTRGALAWYESIYQAWAHAPMTDEARRAAGHDLVRAKRLRSRLMESRSS